MRVRPRCCGARKRTELPLAMNASKALSKHPSPHRFAAPRGVPTIAASILLALSLGSPVPRALGEESDAETLWLDDFDAAAAQSEADEKPILAVFTGSDWIELARNFEDEILSQAAFLEPVAERFVLLKLEFPEPDQGEVPEGHEEARELYGVRGYPMVVLLGEDLRPFGINGYQPIGAEEYAHQIVAMQLGNEERLALAEEARGLVGIERAEALLDALPDLPPHLLVRHYREELEEFVRSDPEDETGEAEPLWLLLAEFDYLAEMQRLAEEVQWSRMIELSHEYIEAHQLRGEPLQRALLNIARVQGQQQNLAGRVQTLITVVNVAPESEHGVEAQRQLDLLRVEKLQSDLAPVAP